MRKSLSSKEWFAHYSRIFDTVEINNTFYNLPAAETFAAWRDAAPKGFCFALKMSRYATHMKKLKDPDGPIESFLAAAGELKSRLGPILVQLPPHWDADPGRLDAFLDAAPARRRWAVELRDPSWFSEDVYDVLRKHNAALCIHDMMADHPRIATADWVYLRFHGPASGKYEGSYSPQALTATARRIARHLDKDCDVYAYFNNDQEGYAPANAQALARYVRNRQG